MINTSQSSLPKVFVVIISQFKRSCIFECIDSVLDLDYPDYEVIIVDHHTISFEWIHSNPELPVTIFQTPEKLGIASARNFGISLIQEKPGNYIFLIDNDIRVKKDCLTKLVLTMQSNPMAGMVAPLIYQNNGLILSQGGIYIGSIGQPILLGLGKKLPNDFVGKIVSVDFATGAISLIRRDILPNVGLQDTRFDPYGFEDIDWCLRILKAGFRILVNENAVVIHLSDYTFHHITYHRLYNTTRKRIFLAQKHLSPLSYYLLFLPWFLLRRCFMVSIKLIFEGKWEMVSAVIKGCAELFRGQRSGGRDQ